MDIDAHAKHINRLLEFKEWAEAKIAELEAKLFGEPVALAIAAEPAATDTPVVEEPAEEPVADAPVVAVEEEKAAE